MLNETLIGDKDYTINFNALSVLNSFELYVSLDLEAIETRLQTTSLVPF